MKVSFPLKCAIIDDSSTLLRLLERKLESYPDLEVTAFADPMLAWSAIQRGDYAIVITDINMPGMFGDQLLRKIQDLRLGIDVIVLTGSDRMVEAYSCMKAGARYILHKSFSDQELREALGGSIHRFERWNDLIDRIVDGRIK